MFHLLLRLTGLAGSGVVTWLDGAQVGSLSSGGPEA
jgi:hypothetical protein